MGANDPGPASGPSRHRRPIGPTSSDNSTPPRHRLRWPDGLRWWELVPEIVLALGLGLFFVTERSAALSAFKSRTAVGLMLAVAVGWLVVRLVLLRWAPWPVLRLVVFAVAA